MKTVIMAGGRGTRISALFPDIPKPLIPMSKGDVCKPVLEWEIENLAAQGFRDIVITVGYMGRKIMDHFGDGSALGANISYFVEDQPLGNAGALFRLRSELDADFLLLNADCVFEIDFDRLVRWHRQHGGLVTLFTHPNDHPFDSGIVVADEEHRVTAWLTKEDVRPQYYRNRVNAGVHVISPEALDLAEVDSERLGMPDTDGKPIKADLDRQVLKPLCGSGRMLAYDSPEYVKDMGTPERFRSVSRDFEAGIVSAKSLKNKQKAIFLDRDGTINRYVGFLRSIDEFELEKGAAAAIRRINSSGFLAIVVSNQPVIARGEVTVPQLNAIHEKMETLLGSEGAYVDGLYYCPHHPDRGFAGEIPELKIECGCRKPKPGMLLEAARDFNIDLSASWMIGDGENDVLAGKAAGCRTAKLGADCGADLTAADLLGAVEAILGDR